MGEEPEDLLPRLLEEIEAAWNAHGDAEAVHRLAEVHPQLAQEFYEFFADLVDSRDDLGRARPEYDALNERVREFLQREGHVRAAAARQAAASSATTDPVSKRVAEPSALRPPPKRTFLGTLREATGESVDVLAAAIGITPDFLVVVSENGAMIPLRARQEFAKRAHAARPALAESMLFASFDTPPSAAKRAASRAAAFAPAPVTFATLVTSSALAQEQKDYWLGLAR